MRLHHLHLTKPIPYAHSLRLQQVAVERHRKHVKTNGLVRYSDGDRAQAPAPILLTFQTHPTYTVGRRHLTASPLSDEQIAFLTGRPTTPSDPEDLDPDQPIEPNLATFFPSPRGGLLTYHGPGQLTAYLILNLRAHQITPRCYVRMLETTVQRTCAKLGVPNVATTQDPGVWITENDGTAQLTNRKICALGVHISNGITQHGLGLNVFDAPLDPRMPASLRDRYTLPANNVYTTDSSNRSSNHPPPSLSTPPSDTTIPAPGYLSWGFSRIIACGLEGKSVTWLSREQSQSQSQAQSQTLAIDEAAQVLATEVAASLFVPNTPVVPLEEDELLLERMSWEELKNMGDDDGPKYGPRDIEKWYSIRDMRRDDGLRYM